MLDSDYFENSAFIDLSDVNSTVGLSAVKRASFACTPNIETVERCPRCKNGFLSRWGALYQCEDHKYLEGTPIGEPFRELKKR